MSTPMATMPAPRSRLPARVAGACAGLVARAAVRLLRFDHVTTSARWLQRLASRRATPDETLSALRAVDAGAALLPFRVACLERSLAALLLLAARRRGVTWRIGVRTPPITIHAWLADASGEPIGESSPVGDYRPLLTILP
jgi:hypothetical protein